MRTGIEPVRNWPKYNESLTTGLRLFMLWPKRPLNKRCWILPAGGLGVSPSCKKSPKIGGYRGLIETISAVSYIC
jgi:hypothetical protein